MSSNLKDILTSINLEHLYSDFVSNGIDVDVLKDLTPEDLAELGLNMGERKRFAKAIRHIALPESDDGITTGPERRQLTVMFMDLVGSTALSASRDVEDFRTVVGAYQSCCAAVIEKNGGMIAKYMGDGILAYFGYPSATEHSAEHAARCGLEVIREVRNLNTVPGVQLSCRVAAATGLVIVGDLIGSGGAQERQVVGDTPNLAGRLQTLASPNQMVVAGSTYKLLKGLFDFKSLGAHDLKGFDEPVTCYAVVGEHEVESRFRATREGRSLTPLRGRDAELSALVEQWNKCRSGHLEIGLLVAEAGIGKSRLLAELVDQISGGPHEVIELACHPQFRNSALRPLRTFAENLFGWTRGDDTRVQFAKLKTHLEAQDMSSQVANFASTLGIPPDGLYTPPTEAPQVQRVALASGLARMLAKRAEAAPLLVLLEDLHWADATTLEVLDPLLAGLADAPVLFLATSRPEEDLALANDPRSSVQHLMGINSDAAEDLTRILAGGRRLSADLTSQILAQAEGNPLFLEELTKSLIESDAVRDDDGVIRVKERGVKSVIPATLQDSLMARLDRVTTAKELAQIGAVLGREFSLDLLAAVCNQPADEVVDRVAVLEDAELVFPIEGRADKSWIFKHALIQEAAYDSLLRSRRRELHGLIAQAYEAVRPDETVSQPEIMAHHLGEAGEHRRAVDFGLAAGMGALMRSANSDAVAHGRNCLGWTANIADTDDRGQLELKVQAILTPALMQSQGYTAPDVEESARRALELLELHGNRPEAFPNLWGLNMYHHVRSEREQARNVAERFIGLAEQVDDGSQLVAGLPLIGQCSWIEGNLAVAEVDLRRGIELYDADAHGMHGAMYGFDSFSYCQMTLSQVLWMTGRSTEAVAAAEAALSHARALKHTNTIGIALLYQIMLKQQNGLRAEVEDDAAEALRYCARMGVSTPTSYIGMIANWALGNVAASQEIYDVHKMVGAQLGMTYYRSLGAENAIDAGDLDVAREILDVALEQARNTGERYWLPQLLRLQARIETDPGTALACLTEAIEKARASGAFMLEALAIIDIISTHEGSGTSLLYSRLNDLVGHKGVELPEFAKARLEAVSIGAS